MFTFIVHKIVYSLLDIFFTSCIFTYILINLSITDFVNSQTMNGWA
jgi:hypothetical protein